MKITKRRSYLPRDLEATTRLAAFPRRSLRLSVIEVWASCPDNKCRQHAEVCSKCLMSQSYEGIYED
ncbi:hypothetical protein ACS0TY_036758 [Phlomoides rotata]